MNRLPIPGLVITLLVSFSTLAQTEITDFEIEYSSIQLRSDAQAHFLATAKITLSDTADIDKIHLEVGTTDGTKDVFEKDYSFNAGNNLRGVEQYSRGGNIIYLRLFTLPERRRCHYKVYATDGRGGRSAEFSRAE